MARSAEHLGPAAQCQAQVGFAGFALTHFQKACGKIGARHGIVRTERQGMPVGVGGGRIVAIQQKDASELGQYLGTPRRSLTSGQKNLARFDAFIPVQVQPCKIQLQIDGFRRQCKTTFYNRDGLFDASGLDELTGEFLEGRRKWRTPRRGLAQLFDRFRAAPRAAERRPKQGFNARIAAAACCLLEVRDRIGFTILTDQGPSQDRYRGGVAPARSQDFTGELLGLGELPLPQRKGGAFEQLSASAANGLGGRMLRHDASYPMTNKERWATAPPALPYPLPSDSRQRQSYR
jgi:hypothetical protein